MFAPASLGFSIRHEMRLTWRDFIAMATAGKRTRVGVLLLVLAAVAIMLHFLAYAMISPWVAQGITPDIDTLILVSGMLALMWAVTLSQALESVTRAYYTRADLDLYLSSPASPRTLFVVRTGAIAVQTLVLSALLACPFINMLALLDGPHWLAAYGALAALAALAVAVAILLTQVLFASIGARRTRLVAQVLAALIGAGFAIGVQAAAILALGEISRFSLFQSQALLSVAPAGDSLFWLPARAAMGDGSALVALVLASLCVFAVVCALAAPNFARFATAAAGLSAPRVRQKRARAFRPVSAKHALRLKEWNLLIRDPWLVSQSLMQMLYLIPPALLLWLNYGDAAGVLVVTTPIVVMAIGQLAGGLAWLTISGEDAHDLVVTAPIPARVILRAKVEAVLAVIAVVLAPFVLALLLVDVPAALVTTLMASIAAGSATAIQLWFRTPMRRAMFRRRQVSSRAATICEALASIMWAGTAALLVAGGPIMLAAAIPALIALGVMIAGFALSPKGRMPA